MSTLSSIDRKFRVKNEQFCWIINNMRFTQAIFGSFHLLLAATSQ